MMTSDTFQKIEMRNLSKDNENPLGATSQGRGCTVECCVTSAKHCKRWEINQDEKDEINIQKTEAFKSDAGPAVPNAAKNFITRKVSLTSPDWPYTSCIFWYFWKDDLDDEFSIDMITKMMNFRFSLENMLGKYCVAASRIHQTWDWWKISIHWIYKQPGKRQNATQQMKI